MTKPATVHVPPGILRWGRDRAKADLTDAAAKCGHAVADLTAWEEGQSDPPLTALRELAAFYQLPLAAFLLTKPKDEPTPTVDLRRLAGVDNPITNRSLALALRRATGLQVLAAELQEALDAAPFAVEESTPDAEALANRERALLGVTESMQLSWREDQAFRRWREAIERRGVLVMQSPLGDSDVRAFSLRGDPPVIVVNRGDWVRAKVFSLAHEFGHVAIGEGGICIPGAMGATGIEAFCNHFADALLIPSSALLKDRDVRNIIEGVALSDAVIKRIANRYKVSPAVVWYRLKQTKVIGQATFDRQWTNWATWRPPAEDGGGPSTTAQNAIRDYGVALLDLMLRASKKGLVSTTDVSQYLGVGSDSIPSIEMEVASRLTP